MLVHWYTVLLPLFTAVIAIINYRSLNTSLKFLFLYTILGVLSEFSNFLLVKVYSTTSMPLGNIYFFLSFLLLGIYFMHVFKGFIKRKYIIALIVVYELAFIANLVLVQSINEYPTVLKGISDIFLFSLAGVFFHKTMIEAKIDSIWKEPLVYANLGILLYFSGSLFYSILFNLVLEYAPEFTNFSQNYFYVLNGFFYLLIAIAFWIMGRQKKEVTN